MLTNELAMQRCIEIAKNGLGTTRPNPMVGAIIVHNGKIIGEGFTSPYGGPHAEVNAINSVKNKDLLLESSLYVTLEPCNHTGKTPPCADLIVKHKIPKVFIGCTDNNPEVNGSGIKKLRDSGCEVITDLLEDDCKILHKRFFTFHNKKRPYIILKWAESSDGFISPLKKEKKEPVWITNSISRQLVHKWRSEEQSILVGTNTVIEDNPSLTTRDWQGQHPIRIVIDKNLKLNTTYSVFSKASKTLVLTSQKKELSTNKHIRYHVLNWAKTETIAAQICTILYNENITSVIIEGGTKTIQTFINENLWDEARVFKGSVNFKQGVKAPVINRVPDSSSRLTDDLLSIYVNY